MVALFGDTHNIQSDFLFKAEQYMSKYPNLTKKDYAIVLGDFGFLSKYSSVPLEKNIDFFNNFPFTTLFIDGNHENFEMILSLEEVEMFDSIVGKVSDSLFHLKRGMVYNIDSKSFFTMGGALSIDKNLRVVGMDWFPEEIPSYSDEMRGIESLERVENKVDYVLTHTCIPSVVHALAGEYNLNIFQKVDSTTLILNEFDKIIHCKKWFFGHFHVDKCFFDKYHCVMHEVQILK